MSDFQSVIKNKNFLLLWLSQFLSQIAINTLNFLVMLRVFDATGSTVATSLVWVGFILPAITIGPFAAALVDRIGKKKVLMIANLVQAIIMLTYAFVPASFVYLSYIFVVAYSLFNQFYIPAELASLPYLVEKKKLPLANGLFLITLQLGLVVGFGIAGVMSDLLSFETAFLFAAGVMFIAFLAVGLLPSMEVKNKADKFIVKKVFSFVGDVLEGFAFIRDRREVLLPFVTIVGLQVALPVALVNLPIISRDILGINPHYSGMAVTTPAGIGAMIGIIFVSKRLLKKRKLLIVKNALTFLMVSFWGAMILVPILAYPYKLIASTILFIVVGISFIGVFIPAQTHLQVSTPNELMARVFGNSWFVTSAATVFPMLFSASIVDLFGIRTLVILMGLAVVWVRVNFDQIVEGRILFFLKGHEK